MRKECAVSAWMRRIGFVRANCDGMENSVNRVNSAVFQVSRAHLRQRNHSFTFGPWHSTFHAWAVCATYPRQRRHAYVKNRASKTQAAEARASNGNDGATCQEPFAA
jgi:hypothetical protein